MPSTWTRRDRAPAHTLDVSDELILRALLDGHPLGTTVAAMVVDDQAKPERVGERGQGAPKSG
jgi:hypothetical protein